MGLWRCTHALSGYVSGQDFALSLIKILSTIPPDHQWHNRNTHSAKTSINLKMGLPPAFDLKFAIFLQI